MNHIRKLVLSGLFLALAIVLPMLAGNVPTIGVMLCPMHLPVLLCGYFCGYKYGGAVGGIALILKVLIFQAPPLFPVGIAMFFELVTYGLVTGLMYEKLTKNIKNIYISLISAMVLGRIVWGVSMFLLLASKGGAFSFSAFISGAVLSSIPGIISQIILVPAIVFAAEKTNFLKRITAQ